MVSGEDLRKIERLAEQHRISQRPQSDPWPSSHQSTFQRIEELGQATFQAYSDSINPQSGEPLWRRQNRARALALVQEAGRLLRNDANESAWRMGIENIILDRFSVEVACPTCKHRLWQSEIESSHVASSRIWTELDERRLNRQPCTCSPGERIQDRFEIGTSRLFEQQVEEVVLHGIPVSELPNQKPDRIIGLRQTRNIRELLDRPPYYPPGNNARSVRDLVRCSPFKWQPSPHLFPFLALEAKSSTASSSFSGVQTQTAFPIRTLLNLQKDLQSKFTRHDEGRPEPLVWFLGYRGSDWRIYGCYLGLDSTSHTTYNIHYLRGGDITTKDGALQLLLLVDYMVDWARDVYRPSIITQLTSLAMGIDFDEVSLGPDTDIISKNKSIWDWIQPSEAGATVQHEATHRTENQDVDPGYYNDIPSLKRTEYGRVRSVSATIFQLIGLRLTESNVESLLALLDTPVTIDLEKASAPNSASARKLLNEITKYDEILVVLGSDLDDIERVWTDEEIVSNAFHEGPETEFYVVFEYRCFVNLARDVVRDLSYMAFSKSAFEILKKHAAFQRHPWIPSFPKTLRPCPGALIKDAINCLRSGSRWQVLLSAMSSTLLSIYPQPERKREDSSSPTVSLGFGHPRSVRVKFFIETSVLKKTERHPPKLKEYLHSPESARKRFKAQSDAWEETTCNRSFRRTYQRTVRSLDALHDPSECNRCRSSNQDVFALANWDQQNKPSLTAYGAILVVSLEESSYGRSTNRSRPRHNLTLFILDEYPWLDDEVSVSTVVQDLAQSSSVYHTILHDPSKAGAEYIGRVWNLPVPYRRTTCTQRWDITRWIGELNGLDVLESDGPAQSMHPWTHQQMLLHFLRGGLPYDDALAAVLTYCDKENEELERRSRAQHGETYLWRSQSYFLSLSSFWYDMRPSRSFQKDDSTGLLPKLRLRGDDNDTGG